MWLMGYITNNSITQPGAVKGSVTNDRQNISVLSSSEHKNIDVCLPYGIESRPPLEESAVVLPLANGEVSVGVIAPAQTIEPGEIKLCSKGGASIILKNNGKVIINGKEF